MCGISGIIYRAANRSADEIQSQIEMMTEVMKHRGPDYKGTWADAKNGVALGHRRLAIVDLTPTGDQPMVSADGRYVLTLNGEIYNHRQLRAELSAINCKFRGTSDTEVVLSTISQWGIFSAINKFVGMFAFGLWDKYEKTMYLVRDRMGEKPLYYGWCGAAFAFGSELKALRSIQDWQAEIDRDALSLYFRFNYVPSAFSIYKGIYKLLPGSILTLPKERIVAGSIPEPVRYWSLDETARKACSDPFRGTDEEAINELERLLKESVSGQMMADVPIGAFLSGGIDSSTIVALMQAQSPRPVRTFTIGFREAAYSETGFARAVARHLGTDHTELEIAPRDALNVIPLLPDLYDEPFADSSQIPTFLVARLARKHVTVSLSGDGGDEVFCGYNRHVKLDRLWRYSRLVPQSIRKGFSLAFEVLPTRWYDRLLEDRLQGVLGDQVQKSLSILKMANAEEMYLSLASIWPNAGDLVLGSSEPPTLLSKPQEWPLLPSYLDRLLYVESATSLPDDMLVKVDRAAMGVSLETRVPFLDHRVVEFSWRLPIRMKLHQGVSKWILRQVLAKYVPPPLVDRPKSGFGVPIDTWLKGPLKSWADDLLAPRRLADEGFLNASLVWNKWNEHLNGYRKWQHQLWSVLMFEAWLDRYKRAA